ncbi:MAG: hypothetical protein ACRCYY_09370 [Trueperaceae bacterium]
MLNDRNRIKFAFLLENWSYKKEQKPNTENTRRVMPEEYTEDMDGILFCPICFTNLIRVPKYKEISSNKRKPYFSHLPKYSDIPCELRSTKPEGRKYNNQEEALQAIENEELVVIHSFQAHCPTTPNNSSSIYNQTVVEDQQGPLTEVPISRHIGKTFRLPSRISTVNSLCRNFDKNLDRYFCFPTRRSAVLLYYALTDIKQVKETNDEPKLYFGVIKEIVSSTENPKPTHILITKLEYPFGEVWDFSIKDTQEN